MIKKISIGVIAIIIIIFVTLPLSKVNQDSTIASVSQEAAVVQATTTPTVYRTTLNWWKCFIFLNGTWRDYGGKRGWDCDTSIAPPKNPPVSSVIK